MPAVCLSVCPPEVLCRWAGRLLWGLGDLPREKVVCYPSPESWNRSNHRKAWLEGVLKPMQFGLCREATLR